MSLACRCTASQLRRITTSRFLGRSALDGKAFKAPLRSSHKREDVLLTRLSLFNHQLSRNDLSVLVDDVVLNGEQLSFGVEPEWEGDGNHAKLRDCVSPTLSRLWVSPTNFVGGQPSEIDGIVWLIESPRPKRACHNAAFGRFGIVSWHRGGHYVEIYLDGLEFTSASSGALA